MNPVRALPSVTLMTDEICVFSLRKIDNQKLSGSLAG